MLERECIARNVWPEQKIHLFEWQKYPCDVELQWIMWKDKWKGNFHKNCESIKTAYFGPALWWFSIYQATLLYAFWVQFVRVCSPQLPQCKRYKHAYFLLFTFHVYHGTFLEQLAGWPCWPCWSTDGRLFLTKHYRIIPFNSNVQAEILTPAHTVTLRRETRKSIADDPQAGRVGFCFLKSGHYNFLCSGRATNTLFHMYAHRTSSTSLYALLIFFLRSVGTWVSMHCFLHRNEKRRRKCEEMC